MKTLLSLLLTMTVWTLCHCSALACPDSGVTVGAAPSYGTCAAQPALALAAPVYAQQQAVVLAAPSYGYAAQQVLFIPSHRNFDRGFQLNLGNNHRLPRAPRLPRGH